MDLKRKYGFPQERLWVLKGGMYSWQDAGLPTVKSSDALRLQGPSLYAQHCSTCHQTGGEGVPGVVPPLAGSLFMRDPSGHSLLRVTYQGSNTGRFQTAMPGFWRLSDLEVAAIASHCRKKFGPAGAQSELTASLAAEVRADLGASPPLPKQSPAPHAHPPGDGHGH